jgi:hypothetical protein
MRQLGFASSGHRRIYTVFRLLEQSMEGIMAYVLFSLWFTLLHTAVYTIAGAIALRISKDLYEEKTACSIFYEF